MSNSKASEQTKKKVSFNNFPNIPPPPPQKKNKAKTKHNANKHPTKSQIKPNLDG